MFGGGWKSIKCKTQLKLVQSRIKLLRNKRENQLKQMRRDIAALLAAGQEPNARIRVEHIIREENIIAAYDIIDLFCELIVVRLPVIDSQKQCPQDLKEAISSIIFAAPRSADLPELLQAKQLFQAKYGKDFIMAAEELWPSCGVNRNIIEKLSVRTPSAETKIALLKAIAVEQKVDWDPTKTEEELLHGTSEDLLHYEGSAGAMGLGQPPNPFQAPPKRPPPVNPFQAPPQPPPVNPFNSAAPSAPPAQPPTPPWTPGPVSSKGQPPPGEDAHNPFSPNPLNYPPSTEPSSLYVTPGYGGSRSTKAGLEEGDSNWAQPPSRPVPFQPHDDMENSFETRTGIIRRVDSQRDKQMAEIKEVANKAREAAARASEAARSAAGLAGVPSDESHSFSKDEIVRPEGASGKGGGGSTFDNHEVAPAPPGGDGGFFHKSGKGGSGFIAVPRYTRPAGNELDSPPTSPSKYVTEEDSDPPATGVGADFATGSAFDEFVVDNPPPKNSSHDSVEEDEEIELPSAPTAPPAPIQRGTSGSSMPPIDDLAKRFAILQKRANDNYQGY